MTEVSWRVLRAMGNAQAVRALRKLGTPALDKGVAKQIKGATDARGKRRGTEGN